MNIVLNREKRNNIFILIVCLMTLSGVVSSAVVLLDSGRPPCYRLLWLLPAVFCFNCLLVYTFRKMLFTRISITMMTGLYWIRMVVTPVVMVLGGYAVVPENTSWQAYMDKAILLECYEACIMFALLSLWSKKLTCENRNPYPLGNTEKFRYSKLFFLVFGLICLFFFGMILRWPTLIRYRFIPIWGAPEGWVIRVFEQRSIRGTGSGPLGIFVTQWSRLILIMQILLPAVILTWILNHRRPWTNTKKAVCVFLLAGAVFVIATNSRINSVYAALALLLTLISYSSGKQLRMEAVFLLLVPAFALLTLCVTMSGGANTSETIFPQLSRIFTAYFSGPQNTAAAIQAAADRHGPNPFLIAGDMVQHIPDLGAIWKNLAGRPLPADCADLFNQTLYGVTEGRKWDQLVSPIGEGYMHGGFLLAPLIPAVTARLSVWMEQNARKSRSPVFKNLCYAGAEFMACAQVEFSIGQAMSFLWYIGVMALIALPIVVKWRSIREHKPIGTAVP